MKRKREVVSVMRGSGFRLYIREYFSVNHVR